MTVGMFHSQPVTAHLRRTKKYSAEDDDEWKSTCRFRYGMKNQPGGCLQLKSSPSWGTGALAGATLDVTTPSFLEMGVCDRSRRRRSSSPHRGRPERGFYLCAQAAQLQRSICIASHSDAKAFRTEYTK
ncbi:hypothetical protein HYFRA_00003832 [Hymenoscyphus fraxineus]|uniref:Uncharacterized protein n=1 Tax=Hymenoscyphus fraxineus TaxID=746836 RepID=A0A9N9L2M9_9HELO|nr:hypothetical protein HYFRA_00003832 [Hymenoscyphus fraxineus]